MINRYAKGTFNIRQLDNGYDINEDGKVDIPKDRIPQKGPSFAQQFVGQPLDKAWIQPHELEQLNADISQGATFTTHPLVRQRLFTMDQLALQPHQGVLSHERELVFVQSNGEVINGFTVNREGQVVYNPSEQLGHMETPDPSVVNHWWGTSVSTPVAVAEDLLINKR